MKSIVTNPMVTAAYTSQLNGRAEHMVKTLNQSLTPRLLEEDMEWNGLLDDKICAHRVRRAADRCSSCWLMYGIQSPQATRCVSWLNQTFVEY